MLETSLLPREKQVDGGLDTGVNKTVEDLEGDTQKKRLVDNSSNTLWAYLA